MAKVEVQLQSLCNENLPSWVGGMGVLVDEVGVLVDVWDGCVCGLNGCVGWVCGWGVLIICFEIFPS
jgi:hypothetical protein